jgi:hypothetical protein
VLCIHGSVSKSSIVMHHNFSRLIDIKRRKKMKAWSLTELPWISQQVNIFWTSSISHVWAHGELSLIHLNMKYPSVAEISDKWRVKYFCDNFCITFLLLPYSVFSRFTMLYSFLSFVHFMHAFMMPVWWWDGYDLWRAKRKLTVYQMSML